VTESRFDLLARNLRRLRHERGYSLSELARRAALAKQTLSSIEAGQANPTVLTLSEIAAALAVPVAHLLIEYGSPVLVRRASEERWSDGPNGTVRELDRVYGSGYVHTSLIRYTQTGDGLLHHRAHRSGTLHHAYVISGEVAIGPAGEHVELSRGDFIRFPGDLPHRTHVVSPTAVLHMVTTIPHVSQVGRPALTPGGVQHIGR
jgi:transcriptional regulator with XRE-family HTH domain